MASGEVGVCRGGSKLEARSSKAKAEVRTEKAKKAAVEDSLRCEVLDI